MKISRERGRERERDKEEEKERGYNSLKGSGNSRAAIDIYPYGYIFIEKNS